MSDYTGPGTYKVWSRHSGKVLDIGNGDKDGERVRIWKETTDAKYTQNQIFTIVAAGGDEFLFLHAKKGLYLASGSKRHEHVYGYWTSPLNKQARWKIIPVHDGSGSYYIESVALPGLFLDISGGNTADDTPAFTWEKNGGESQQFFLRLP